MKVTHSFNLINIDDLYSLGFVIYFGYGIRKSVGYLNDSEKEFGYRPINNSNSSSSSNVSTVHTNVQDDNIAEHVTIIN